MGKTHVNARLEASTLEALDAYAEAHGMTRTAAIEALIGEGLKAVSGGAGEPREAERDADREGEPPGDLRAVVEVLRASNADLRAHVSQLYAQLSVKDEQIRQAHELADHSQRLHMAEVAKALPPEGGNGRTLRERLAAIFSADRGRG